MVSESLAEPKKLIPLKSSGAERIELAKITGITPPEFTLSGRWVAPPWVIRRPTMRLAYCTGMRRSERSTKMMKATTATIMAIRISNAIGVNAPQAFSARLLVQFGYALWQPHDDAGKYQQ